MPQPLTVSVPDLAHHVVREVAPDELDLFAMVRDRWMAGHRPERRRWTGGTVGSGLVSTLTSDLVLPILVATCTQVCGAAALAAVARRRWWRRRVAEPAAVTVTLDADRLDEFRSALVTHAERLGMPGPDAEVLADAAIGALNRAALHGSG